jgi:MFS family permease
MVYKLSLFLVISANKMVRDEEHATSAEIDWDPVPGTELMKDVGNIHLVQSGKQVLIPQPEDNPNDPLNWSRKWKFAIMAGQTIYGFINQFGPLSVAPQVPYYAEEWDRSNNDVLQFTGVFILVLGFASFIWIPMSTKFGRRLVLVTSSLLGFAVCLWRALAKSYSSMLGASAVHGIASGASQALPPALVTDVMFLHERGLYMGLYSWSVFSAMMVGPIVSGAMTEKYGWRSFWWLNVGLYGFLTVGTLLFMPETKWSRIENPIIEASKGDEKKEHVETSAVEVNAEDNFLGSGSPSKNQFNIFHYYVSETTNIWRPIWVPVKLATFPLVFWSGMVYSWSSCIFLITNLTQSEVFNAAPYNWSSSNVGYANFATFVGASIGLFTAGPFSDWWSKRCTIRNNGIREPEMRLPSMLPYIALSIIGTVVIAVGYQRHWPWEVIIIIGYGMVGIQSTSIISIIGTYAVDCYKPVSGDIFVLASVIKDLWAYGVSKFLLPWIEEVGFITPIMTIYGIFLFLLALGIPVYFTGKFFRRLTKDSFVHFL